MYWKYKKTLQQKYHMILLDVHNIVQQYHSSIIIFCLSELASQKQQVQEGSPDISLPSDTLKPHSTGP